MQLKGYRILDRRARMPACEIDLVARKGRTVVFVEVKSRRTPAMALEAVTPQRRGLQDALWRFDAVLLAPGRLPKHLPDAWRARN